MCLGREALECRKKWPESVPGVSKNSWTRVHTKAVVQQRTLLRRVLRRVLETAFEKVLRRVLRRCLAVFFARRKGSEKGF